MSTCLLLFSVTLLLAAGGAVEEEDCSYRNLLKFLKLDKKNEELAEMRPVKSWKTPTEVIVDMYINAVLDVDAKSQHLTTFVMVVMTWNTDFFKWKPEDFCGIDYLSVPRGNLWKPDIAVLEEIADNDVLEGAHAVVYNWGFNQINDKFPLKTSCRMNLYKFPFDTQTCNITFHSMVHRVEQMVLGYFLTADEISKQIEQAVTSSQVEWAFVSIEREKYNETKSQNYTFHYLKYTITIQRNPLLYVINLLVPVTFFLVLDLASFFINNARGEKMGFKVTLLLSISVLMLILKDMLPATAYRLPLIALHCMGIFLLTGVSLLETMLVCFLLDIDNHVNTMASSEAAAEDAENSLQETEEETSEKSKDTCLDVDCLSDPNHINHFLDAINAAHQQWLSVHVKQEKRTSGYYGTVARRLDTIFAFFYLITAVGFLVYIFIEMTKD